jgi:DNA-binding ferritin-like protein
MQLVKSFQSFVGESYETSVNGESSNPALTLLMLSLLAIRDQAHIFHWQTKSYEQHVALGEFYDNFIDKVDELMENILGKQERPTFSGGTITLKGFSDDAVVEFTEKVKITLSEEILSAVPVEGNDEIYNIVEELKAMVNKLNYLLSLK